MRQGLEPALHTLPEAQRELWPRLQQASQLGFVLYGGTAIAIRLGHRVSVDFDLFTDRPLNHAALTRTPSLLQSSRVIQESPDTLTVLATTSDPRQPTVKLSFFGGIGFGRIGTPDATTDGVLQVASLTDLLATKLKVILQRAEAKDYIDIVAILQAGVSLPVGLAGARTLFGPAFQPSESLKALTFFEDGDLPTLSGNERSTLIEAVEGVAELPTVPLISKVLAVP